MKHHENCDVNDANLEGIRKPCNCGAGPAAGSGTTHRYEIILIAKTYVEGFDSCDASQAAEVSNAVTTLRGAGWEVHYEPFPCLNAPVEERR